jgi:hypothetical protein
MRSIEAQFGRRSTVPEEAVHSGRVKTYRVVGADRFEARSGRAPDAAGLVTFAKLRRIGERKLAR